MTAKDVMKSALTSTQHMLGMFVADLSDADFLVRPVPTANHIAWQLGHLIKSEHQFIAVAGGPEACPKLPDGFADQHTKQTASQEPPKGFGTKAQYLDLFNKTREAALSVLAKMSDADLDKPTAGDMAKFAPTMGSLFLLMANHTMMHAGQFTVVRRKLGKPVLF
jgi:uncharacterized damage-inducible protein DinB